MILVAGLINIETTLQIDGFPLPYYPQSFPFFGVNSSVSGVGYNVAKALHTLGNPVNFLSLIGDDFAGRMTRETLAKEGIPDPYVLTALPNTPQSVILYDKMGRRQAHSDLKNVQEVPYPAERFEQALAGCKLAVLCNINFTRPFLSVARRAGICIATDVHNLSQLDDAYNTDYLRAADILFMSDEKLPCSPELWARQIMERYGNEVVVIGMGAKGALLAVKRDSFIGQYPAVQTRLVVNTIGAGDALFSCFVHVYHQNHDPYDALHKAMVFASWKIGTTGAADGFLDAKALEELI